MKALKLSCLTLLAALLIGVGTSPAHALELFTNFNDGMELNWRPYGIPDNAPARYQSGHPCVNMIWRYPARTENCPACGSREDYSNTGSDGAESGDSRPTEIQPAEIPAVQTGLSHARNVGDEDWMRGANFLPSHSTDNDSDNAADDSSEDSAE
jgi:hypothetical protein